MLRQHKTSNKVSSALLLLLLLLLVRLIALKAPSLPFDLLLRILGDSFRKIQG